MSERFEMIDDARTGGSEAIERLRHVFPTCQPNEMNFCLFSTSGVHGSYETIEEAWRQRPWGRQVGDKGEAWASHGPWVTYLLIHPRTVRVVCGNVRMRHADDYRFLKALRDRGIAMIAKGEIGK